MSGPRVATEPGSVLIIETSFAMIGRSLDFGSKCGRRRARGAFP